MRTEDLLRGKRIVIISPHADDEILGCGGLISAANRVGAETYIMLATLSGFSAINGGTDSDLAQRREEFEQVCAAANVNDVDVFDPEGKYHLELDSLPIARIISWLEQDSSLGLSKLKPDVVLIPSADHSHQDHQTVHKAALSALRMNISLPIVFSAEYEIPGTGQAGFPSFDPNLYLALDQAQLDRKCGLFSLYASQVSQKPSLRSLHAISTLASYRGMESGHEFAEAFRVLRINIPVVKSRQDRVVERLYLQEDVGLDDVAKRLDINTRQGSFDFQKVIADTLDLQLGDRLLDVGCGTGKHIASFRDAPGIVPVGIDVAVSKDMDPDIEFRQASACAIPFPDASFDKLMCNYALYYVEDWQKAIDEMRRVVVPGGQILITGPDDDNNVELYAFHRELFGDISEIDKLSSTFSQSQLEPFLHQSGTTFSALTYDNRVVFHDPSALLTYYTSTTLFRMTCVELDPAHVVYKVKAGIEAYFATHDSFINTKKVRFVHIQNMGVIK